jgi:hypothetical protein
LSFPNSPAASLWEHRISHLRVECPFLCAHRPRLVAPDGRLSGSSDTEGDHRRVSRRSPLVSRGYRPPVDGSLTAFGSRDNRVHHAAPGCLGLRVQSVFGHFGCRDDRQLHSPRWAARGSPGGWRNPRCKALRVEQRRPAECCCHGSTHPLDRLVRSKRKVSIGYRPPPGRYPVWRRVCNQAPQPFGDVIREKLWWIHRLRAGNRRVRNRSANPVSTLRSTCKEVRRSRGLVPQVLPRPGGHPGRNPSG